MNVLLATIVGTVVGTVVVLEASAWIPYISRRIVQRVLEDLPTQLPHVQRDRWVEEVKGDLETFADRPFGGLFFALGLWRRGGKKLSEELLLQAAPAASANADLGLTEDLGSENEEDDYPYGLIPYLDNWVDRGYASHAIAQLRKVERWGWRSDDPEIAALRKRVEDWEKLPDWEKE